MGFSGLLSVLVFPASVVCAGSCGKAERPPETRHDCAVFLIPFGRAVKILRPCCKNPSANGSRRYVYDVDARGSAGRRPKDRSNDLKGATSGGSGEGQSWLFAKASKSRFTVSGAY